MKRTEIINHLIKKNGYKKYLEIGVDRKELNFKHIECKEKYWCDPSVAVKGEPGVPGEVCGYGMGSDTMFELFDSDEKEMPGERRFDIIFIDGLHIAEQVKRDIENSLRYLTDNGTIVVHDCNPELEDMGKEEWILPEWCGTVWKGWIEFIQTNEDKYWAKTIDTDYGVGILCKRAEVLLLKGIPKYNKQKFLSLINWEYFNKNRKELLNLIEESTFLEIFK